MKSLSLFYTANISANQVCYMQEMIIEYLEKHFKEFPPLHAKHNFILHYPAMTLKRQL